MVYHLKWGDVSYVGKHACKPNDRYVASGVLVILMWCARGPPTRSIIDRLDDKAGAGTLEKVTLRAVDRKTRSVSWLNINFYDGATTTTTNPTDPTHRPLTDFYRRQPGPAPPPPTPPPAAAAAPRKRKRPRSPSSFFRCENKVCVCVRVCV